ncbi:MAG: DNA polymerase IV [Lachnospiraceae bacterium]|nr:DNA polymerase IV [Lachnospiraceae bacterium]
MEKRAAEERLIFHIDVNSAFLSWEAARRVKQGQEDLRLIPSCVGGNPQKRTGIVLAKSIPAKKFGVVTGEPMSQALRKCPHLVSVKPDFRLYESCSKAFKSICNEYAPAMESFSIDEVFLDMTGTGRIYPDPVAVAHEIKDRIRDTLGFTVNVGIGPNKLLAKMASDFEKPDKVHTLFSTEIRRKMWILPVRDLLTVGKMTAEKLNQNQIFTIGDLACSDLTRIQKIVGHKMGIQIHRYANGIDDSPVRPGRDEAKGYSVETTLEYNIEKVEDAWPILLTQADIAAARMRSEGAKCRCVSVVWRTTEFVNRSHQCRLKESTDVTTEIYETARKLFRESWNGQPLRLIGLSLTELDDGSYEQLSFIRDENKEKMRKMDQAVDALRGKFGNDIIKRGSTLDASGRIGRKYRAQMENDSGKSE